MTIRSITEKQQHRVYHMKVQATNVLPVAIFYTVDLLCSKCAELIRGRKKYIKEGELKGYFMFAWEMGGRTTFIVVTRVIITLSFKID